MSSQPVSYYWWVATWDDTPPKDVLFEATREEKYGKEFKNEWRKKLTSYCTKTGISLSVCIYPVVLVDNTAQPPSVKSLLWDNNDDKII